MRGRAGGAGCLCLRAPLGAEAGGRHARADEGRAHRLRAQRRDARLLLARRVPGDVQPHLRLGSERADGVHEQPVRLWRQPVHVGRELDGNDCGVSH